MKKLLSVKVSIQAICKSNLETELKTDLCVSFSYKQLSCSVGVSISCSF